VRREGAEVLAAAASGSAVATLTKVAGDSDREVRAVASLAVATRQPATAPAAVRAIGARADATTIAPLALTAWPQLAKDMIGEPSTRAWALAVSLIGRRVAELIAIATAKGDEPTRIAALAALGRTGGEEAKVALERIHADEAEADAVKLAAWKALKRLMRTAAKTYAEGQDKGPGGTRPAVAAGGGSDAEDEDDEGDEDEDAEEETDDEEDAQAKADDDGDDDEGDDDDDEDEDDEGDDDDEDFDDDDE